MSRADVAGISVVVPVYNSEGTLDDLLGRLEPVLAGLDCQFEVVLVNDGSHDGSWAAIGRLTQRYGFLRGIDMLRNYGQHNALLCGIRAARYDVIVTLDDDLQNPPEEIPRLLEPLNHGFDVVYGKPAVEQHGLLRDLASVATKIMLQRAMGAATARHLSAFRAFRTRLREAFAAYAAPHVSIDVLLTWGTSRFTAITVDHQPRMEGRSNYTLNKLVTHALTLMTGFSTWPLRVASVTGFVFTLFGFAVLAYVLAVYFVHRGESVPGFPFLASIIAIFSGAQLFALGIMGEYLARMHFRMMGRPAYAVRRTIGDAEEQLASGSRARQPEQEAARERVSDPL